MKYVIVIDIPCVYVVINTAGLMCVYYKYLPNDVDPFIVYQTASTIDYTISQCQLLFHNDKLSQLVFK